MLIANLLVAALSLAAPAEQEELCAFLRFPSVSTDPAHRTDCERCADWLVAWLTPLGFTCEKLGGGERVEDVVVDGVTFADGYKIPIFVRADRRDFHNKGDGLKRGEHNVLQDIVIRNLKGYVIGPTASSITGTKAFRVQNVLLENIDIIQPGAGEAAGRLALADPAPYRENCYPAPDIFYPGILPAYGLYVDYADNVVLKNVRFRTLAEGPVEIRPDVVRTGR